MNRLLIATAAIALTAGGALAQDVRLGVSLGFTGPLESMSPAMASGAEPKKIRSGGSSGSAIPAAAAASEAALAALGASAAAGVEASSAFAAASGVPAAAGSSPSAAATTATRSPP